MPSLITLTGPLAAGKNTVAEHLAGLCESEGRTVVVADVDEVAAMVGTPGAAAAGLWFAAHEAHGALVGAWMRSAVDVVIAIGPFFEPDQLRVLYRQLPDDVTPLRVLLHAEVAVTWPRALADETRGLSRQWEFHVSLHEQYTDLRSGIAADLTFDTGLSSAEEIAAQIVAELPDAADR